MIETAHGLWDSDWIFERWGHRLREELNYKGTVTAKVALIQERLIQLARNSVNQNRTVWYCVHTLKKMAGRISIRELEERTGYSQRCLEFLFQTHVGLPPKTLAGIFRFQRFYKRWAEGRMYDSLKSDLYDYYYDQSHFSREFKRMTGHSSRKYLLEVDNEYGRRLSLKD